jgi:transcriptional regulator GlxA family with amidase domain
LDPITGDDGQVYLPNRTFAEVPAPYAIVVPGGNTPTIRAMSSPAIRSYLRSAARGAKYTVSVCTGALILASLGMLAGLETTTHWAFAGLLKPLGARYIRKRWVENDSIINSAGVSAGIDMALYLVSLMAGSDTARKVQLQMDYDPRPPFKIDWNRLPFTSKLTRTVFSLTAPWSVAPVKKLIRAGL